MAEKLQKGQIVQIGEETYEIIQLGARKLACVDVCDITNCHSNDAFLFFKREHGAMSCADLLLLDMCFKKVDDDDIG